MSEFALPPIADLHRQLMLSPADVCARYADRLERFLLELEPDRTYPYEFVYFRIVGVRSGAPGLRTFTGARLRPDLLLLLDALAGGAAPPVSKAGERVYTIDEVCARCGVTARTLHRWRRQGLISRRYLFPDGSRRTGVRAGALDRFLAANGSVTAPASRGRRLTRREEADIVERVERLRSQGLSTTAAAAQVAGQVGRAKETVRLVLKRRAGDEEQGGGRLDGDQRRALLAGYRAGTPVAELAARSGRSASSVYRILNQERARELLAAEVDYVGGADLDGEGAMPEEALQALLERLEAARPAPDRPPMTRDEERALFRAYNAARRRIALGRAELDPTRYVATQALRDLEDLTARAGRIKELIARLHLPLLERIVRQHAAGPVVASDLLAQGRAVLGEVIDSFDYTGRGRFGALVTLDLQKAFAHAIAERTELDDRAAGPADAQ